MSKAALAPLIAKCQQEADALRAYCESKFTVGLSVMSEPYTELCITWSKGLPTPAEARKAGQYHFDRYASGKTGTLYWRVVPEIARAVDAPRFVYYMRLLISDKPQISKED